MAVPLWSPSKERVKATNMYRYMNFVNGKYGRDLKDYDSLYRWSVDNISDLWASVWEFVGVRASSGFDQVVDDPDKMPGARWFTGARLNFAENLLRFNDDSVAIIFKSEGRHAVKMTYRELNNEVARVAAALRDAGVGQGDRVAGLMPALPQVVIAMLAAVSLGAVWSSSSPDFGVRGILDRFSQIGPKVLFAADGYFLEGRKHDSLEEVAFIMEQLSSIEKVVLTPYAEAEPDIGNLRDAVLFDEFKSTEDNLVIEFEQLPFEHPLYIMFTSGTTGPPKCLVQSAGGILLTHLKESVIHTDLKRDDVILYLTSCGWMSWNWLVSSLAVGAGVVFYDSSPFYPHPGALLEMAQDEKITMFGTSARYFETLMNKGVKPGSEYDLSPIRTVLSAGSALSSKGYEFLYKEMKDDIWLVEMSGGTDINGNFVLGNPMGPVYAREIQCRGLGMKVEAFNDDGKPCTNEKGELVCLAAAPSMPIYFWDDPDNKKYLAAYFDRWPGVWRHGDYILINERGGIVIYGRSDTTLTAGGGRIGTAEIYPVVEHMEEIQDSLVIEQSWKDDVRVILFVQLSPGIELTEDLKEQIADRLKKDVTPAIIPAKIIAVPDIPYTLNMKKVELAVRKMVEGQPVLNKDSLRNPESLDYFADLKELH